MNCRNTATGCWIKVFPYIQLQCCKAVFTEIAVYSQMLCLRESFHRCKRMVTEFSICVLRIIFQICERFLHKRNLRVRSLQVFFEKTAHPDGSLLDWYGCSERCL